MSNLAWVVTTITSVTTRHFLLESPANRELTYSTKLSRTAAGWGQVHPHKNRRLFPVYLEFVLLKDKRTFPQTHDKKLGRRCPYTFGHIVLISLVFPPPEASPPPAANLHLTLVFLCVIFFEYLKKKKKPSWIRHRSHSMIQMRRAQMIESEWLTACEWSHVVSLRDAASLPINQPPGMLPGGRDGERWSTATFWKLL